MYLSKRIDLLELQQLWCNVGCIHHVARYAESPHPRLSCTLSERKKGLKDPATAIEQQKHSVHIKKTLQLVDVHCSSIHLLRPIRKTKGLTADPSSQSLDTGYPHSYIIIYHLPTCSCLKYGTRQSSGCHLPMYKITTFGENPHLKP